MTRSSYNTRRASYKWRGIVLARPKQPSNSRLSRYASNLYTHAVLAVLCHAAQDVTTLLEWSDFGCWLLVSGCTVVSGWKRYGKGLVQRCEAVRDNTAGEERLWLLAAGEWVHRYFVCERYGNGWCIGVK